MIDSLKIYEFFIFNSNKNLNDTIIFNSSGFDNGQTSSFFDFIETTNLKNIYFFSPWECYYQFTTDIIINQKYTDKINRILENKNIYLKIVYCSDSSDIYENKINAFNGRIEIIYWPTAILLTTYNMIFNQYFQNKYDDIEYLDGIDLLSNLNNKDITTLYSHYNNRPRYHRCMMFDFLSKNNLIELGNNSWNNLNNNQPQNEIVDIYPIYEFKYWKEIILTIDSFNEDTIMMTDTLLNPPSLFNLIGESSSIIPYITEKTFRSLLIGHPFLIYGSKNHNKELLKYGFELYDEIFDYAFEKSDKIEDRILGVINNINKLKDSNYLNLYNGIKPKILRNQKRAIELLKKDEYIPKKLWDFYNKNICNTELFFVSLYK